MWPAELWQTTQVAWFFLLNFISWISELFSEKQWTSSLIWTKLKWNVGAPILCVGFLPRYWIKRHYKMELNFPIPKKNSVYVAAPGGIQASVCSSKEKIYHTLFWKIANELQFIIRLVQVQYHEQFTFLLAPVTKTTLRPGRQQPSPHHSGMRRRAAPRSLPSGQAHRRAGNGYRQRGTASSPRGEPLLVAVWTPGKVSRWRPRRGDQNAGPIGSYWRCSWRP